MRHLSSAIGIAISVVASTAHVAVAQNNGTPPANSDAAPTTLSWQVKDVKDAMTDVVTHKTVSYVDFPNGTSLEASAKCSALGVEFTLGMYSANEKPSTLAWKDDTTQVRVRVDGASVRVARVAKEYINAARLVFYDPDAAMNYMERSVSSLCKKDELMCSALANAQIKEAMDKLRENAPGTLDVLAKAASVRVELVLADGTTNVFDLNPQDQVLKTIVQQCAANLHAGKQTASHGELAPSLPFPEPKPVTLKQPITVYLSDEDRTGVTVTGKIFILGQIAYSSGNYCVVRWRTNNQATLSGIVGINLLGDALDASQRQACYLPPGTKGGVNLSSE